MKETRYFYVPDAADRCELPADEATHAVRVLRLKTDDEIFLKHFWGNLLVGYHVALRICHTGVDATTQGVARKNTPRYSSYQGSGQDRVDG